MSLLLLFQRDVTRPQEADTGLGIETEAGVLALLATTETADASDTESLLADTLQGDSASSAEQVWLSRATVVPPNEVVSQIGITISIPDVDEDPDTPDLAWAIASGDIDVVLGFGSPAGSLTDAPGDNQEIRIRLRPGS